MDLPATTRMLILRDIKVLHLEPTDVCQAACALCARETDTNFRKDRQHHLSMSQVLKVFDEEKKLEEKKKPNVHDFDDMSLFVLIFAEKKLNCSIYIRET